MVKNMFKVGGLEQNIFLDIRDIQKLDSLIRIQETVNGFMVSLYL